VFLPVAECQTNVVLLALFRSSTKKDNDALSVFSEIHSITGAKLILNSYAPEPRLSALEKFPRENRYRAVVTFWAAWALKLLNHRRKGLRPLASWYSRISTTGSNGNIYYAIKP
jgi:hypothetical protein